MNIGFLQKLKKQKAAEQYAQIANIVGEKIVNPLIRLRFRSKMGHSLHQMTEQINVDDDTQYQRHGQ